MSETCLWVFVFIVGGRWLPRQKESMKHDFGIGETYTPAPNLGMYAAKTWLVYLGRGRDG